MTLNVITELPPIFGVTLPVVEEPETVAMFVLAEDHEYVNVPDAGVGVIVAVMLFAPPVLERREFPVRERLDCNRL